MKWIFIFSLLFVLSSCSKSSEMLCENTGGKWASVSAECIRPSCAKTKTCGKWAKPDKWCDKVKIGDSKDSVRFWLGEPNSETPNLMKWQDKLSENEVKAEFKHDILTKLECPK